jgi:hypothetical protein
LQNGRALIDRCGGVGSDLSGGVYAYQRKQNGEEQPKTQAHRQ